MGGGDPNRNVLLNQSSPIIPETGAGKYWYVDPHAPGIASPTNPMYSPEHEDQGAAQLQDALRRLFQPKANTGTYQF